MENNQKIKCRVQSCKFQNSDNCTLEEIQVGCSCGSNEATKDKQTLCKSFECDNEKTDTDK